ncbi:MAG: hypothetical protein NVSMB66_2800 [Candidatus Doudnabacteria bacterium]
MKYKICVSGSAANNCGAGAFKKAWEVGYQIAKSNAVLVTGATIGIPEWSTRGAKAAKGMSIGISPAASHREHVKKYHLPTANLDMIMYTGFEYSGRNLLLVRSSDAVIEICGRIGTLNEFTIAFEDKKPIGVLLGTGGAVEDIPHILDIAKRGHKNVIFDTDPVRLVKKVLKAVKEQSKMIEKAEKNVRQRRLTSPD